MRLFMLAVVVLVCAVRAQLVITEVSPNPTGGSTSIPGDLSHEFIEVYNAGALPVNLCRYYLKSSSAGSTTEPDSNNLQVWAGDSLRDIGGDSALVYDSLLQPGAYAVILGRKYVSAPESSWYHICSGTFVFATRKTYLRSGGLSNSASVVRLFSGENSLVSSFNARGSTAMEPGEGFTWQRQHPDSADLPQHWKLAAPTPGSPYPYSSSRAYARTLCISEFMCDPLTGNAEWVELYNYGVDTVDLLGWTLQTGDETGYVSLASLRVSPAAFVVLRASGTFPADVLCPVLLPSAWGGLSRNGDTIVIRDESGISVDSICYSDNDFEIIKGVSMERVSFAASAVLPSNWRPCPDPVGATPGYKSSTARDAAAFSFNAGNRRIVPGCGSLSFINMYLNVPSQGELTLKVFDLKGGLIRKLYDAAKGVTSRLELWNGRGEDGRTLPDGVYLLYCSYRNGNEHAEKKIPVVLGGSCRAP